MKPNNRCRNAETVGGCPSLSRAVAEAVSSEDNGGGLLDLGIHSIPDPEGQRSYLSAASCGDAGAEAKEA